MTASTRHLVVLTTAPTEADANRLAQMAVEARVAACAQVEGPITSTYRWRGAVETEQEWRVTFKLPEPLYAALERLMLVAHPYDTPELISLPVTGGSSRYLEWLDDSTADG